VAVDELMTPREVADTLLVSESCLRSWRARALGPAWIPLSEKVIRYARRDVDEYLDRQRRGAP